MTRPFPYPVRVGTDICRIPRIYDILTKNGSKAAHRFLDRILTPEERVWYRPRLEPLIQYLAQVENPEFVQLKKAKQEQDRLQNVQTVDGNAKPAEGNLRNGESSAPGIIQELRVKSALSDSSRIVRELEHEAMLEEMRKNVRGVASFIAGRFAAKEATTKAYKHRRLTFHDIMIDNPGLKGMATQAPTVTIRAEKEGEEDQEVPVSISHDGDIATAVCIASEAPSSGIPPVESSIEATTGIESDLAGLESHRHLTQSSYGVDPSVNTIEPTTNEVIPFFTELSIKRRKVHPFSITRAKPKNSPTVEITTRSSIRILDEEQKLNRENRAAKLALQTESIYRLPETIDSKIVKKNVLSCLRVYGFHYTATIEDVIDALDTLPVRYTAIKGYMHWDLMENGGTRSTAFLIMSNKNEARKSSHLRPELKGSELKISSAEASAQYILRQLGHLWQEGKLSTADFGIEGPKFRVKRGERLPLPRSSMVSDNRQPDRKVRWTVPGFKEGEFWTTDVWHVQEGAVTKYAHQNYYTKEASSKNMKNIRWRALTLPPMSSERSPTEEVEARQDDLPVTRQAYT